MQVNLENKYADACFDPAITNANYLKDCLVELGYAVRIAEDRKLVVVHVRGMRCNSCVNKISKAVSAKNGVVSVKVGIQKRV